MKGSKFIFGLMVLGLFMLGGTNLHARAERSVLMIDIPRLDLAEVGPDLPNLQHFLDHGAVGIRTSPLPNPVTPEATYLSFNSGSELKIPADGYRFYNADETIDGQTAGQLYRNLLGRPVKPSNGVTPDFQLLIDKYQFPKTLGRFGKVLRHHRIGTAVIGNADGEFLDRVSAAMLMDETGKVDWSRLGSETLQADAQFPYGYRTNTAAVLTLWRSCRSQAGIVLITLGDLERIQQFGRYLSESRRLYYRKFALREYDRLLGTLMTERSPGTLTVVFSAVPPEQPVLGGTRMTPVVLQGPGFQSGVLVSGSTRRKGLITLEDLPVTVLSYLQVESRGLYRGDKLGQVPGDWRLIPQQQQQFLDNYNIRWPFLTTYAYLLIASLLGTILSWIFGWSAKVISGIRWIYFYLLTIPAVCIIVAYPNPVSWIEALGLTMGLATLLFTAAKLLGRDSWHCLAWLSGLSLLVIIGDGLLNGRAELNSFWGYSAVAGVRFYGIGNEYMGFLLGSYIVTTAIVLHCLKRKPVKLLWALTLLVTVVIIHPNFGANIGGGITALLGLGITTFLWQERPIKLKELILLSGALMLILLGIALWDLYFNKQLMTHFGQFIMFVKTGGVRVLLEMVQRKLQLNYDLMTSSPWTWALIGLLALGPLLYKTRSKVVTVLFNDYPMLFKGWVGLSWTALIGIAVNDTGIVAAATIMIFGGALLLQLTATVFAPAEMNDSVTKESRIS